MQKMVGKGTIVPVYNKPFKIRNIRTLNNNINPFKINMEYI